MTFLKRLDALQGAGQPGGRILLKLFDEPVKDATGKPVDPQDVRAADTVILVIYKDAPGPDGEAA